MRIGTVCYATHQGLGYLAKSFYDAGVITDAMVYRHPHGDRPSRMEWYPPGTIELVKKPFVGEKIERWLDDLQAVIFFETPFDWGFAQRCRERGVKTIMIPMYEWSLQKPPHVFDKFICPSLLDMEYFPQGEFIPIPAPQGTWSLRTKALRFLHNGGNLGARGHKGTLELLKAMPLVKSPIHITIRSQNVAGLQKLIAQVPNIRLDTRIQFVGYDVTYERLFEGFDVLVAPEKFNGLSLPLQEACAAGLMVMTTDRFPTNTWLPTEPLIKPASVHRTQVMGGHMEFDECVVEPSEIARTIDAWYGQNIEQFSLKGKAYAEQNSWDVLKPKYMAAIEGVVR